MAPQITHLSYPENVAVGFVSGINGEQIPLPPRKFWPAAAVGTLVANDDGQGRTYYITLSPTEQPNSAAVRMGVGAARTAGFKAVGLSIPFLGQILNVLWPSPIAKEQFWHPDPATCPVGAQVTVVLLGF